MLSRLKLPWHKAYDVPSHSDFQRYAKETEFTNDAWWLSQFEKQFLFIFNEMMSIHEYPDALRPTGENLMTAYTARDYHLYNDNDYAVALRAKEKDNTPTWADPKRGSPARIKGELWLIDTDCIWNILDPEYENGHTFFRKRITVVVPTHKLTFEHGQEYPFSPELKEIKAWAYIGNPEVWKGLVREYVLKPVDIYRPNNKLLKPYYFYGRNQIVNDEE